VTKQYGASRFESNGSPEQDHQGRRNDQGDGRPDQIDSALDDFLPPSASLAREMHQWTLTSPNDDGAVLGKRLRGHYREELDSSHNDKVGQHSHRSGADGPG
jgi:hypothetical protein